MATPEPQIEKRYFRDCRMVFVRQVDEDHFLVRVQKSGNEYKVTKEVLQEEYEEI